jgi:ankyrin repeat protein
MLYYAVGADINLQDQQGMTPIHEAGYRGQVTVYNELIR